LNKEHAQVLAKNNKKSTATKVAAAKKPAPLKAA